VRQIAIFTPATSLDRTPTDRGCAPVEATSASCATDDALAPHPLSLTPVLAGRRRHSSTPPGQEETGAHGSWRGDAREQLGQRLYEITIPDLSIDTEFAVVRERLLADFPSVVEVFALRTPGTLLIVYRGVDAIDAWCAALGDAVTARRCARAGRAVLALAA
jgi:hypothetical protein